MKLYLNATLILLIWFAAVLTIYYFVFNYVPRSALFNNDFIGSLSNWDGGHYLGIAKTGYSEKFQYAFFPLYPAAINLFSRVTGDFVAAGILISFSSIFLAGNFLYGLVLKEYGKPFAQKALLALLIFPLSFHFLTVYTESFFLMLVLTAFLFFRKQKYLLAALFAALASATRLSGLGVGIGLILSVYSTGGFNRKNWVVALSPLGLVFYAIYLFTKTGDPFYFISAQSHFWQGGLSFPGGALVFTLKNILRPGFIENNFRDLLDFAFVVFGVFGVFKVFKKLSLDLAIYSLVALVLPLFSLTIAAFPRYLVTIFPIFIALSFYKNLYASFGYLFFGLMLMSIYALLFINGYWVS